MAQGKSSFRHESLQDPESIQDILKAISKGIARGKVNFSDEEGEIELQPEGLLHLKVTARRDDTRNRIDLRITWQAREDEPDSQALKINGSNRGRQGR